MTDQELYSTSRQHLLTQMKRSTLPRPLENAPDHTVCAYRGENGLKCAIGILIPDSKYTPALEGGTVNLQQVKGAAGIRTSQMPIAMGLQYIHDSWAPCEWKTRLTDLAHKHNLRPE